MQIVRWITRRAETNQQNQITQYNERNSNTRRNQRKRPVVRSRRKSSLRAQPLLGGKPCMELAIRQQSNARRLPRTWRNGSNGRTHCHSLRHSSRANRGSSTRLIPPRRALPSGRGRCNSARKIKSQIKSHTMKTQKSENTVLVVREHSTDTDHLRWTVQTLGGKIVEDRLTYAQAVARRDELVA